MVSLDNSTTTEVLDHVLRWQRNWRLLGGLFRRNRNNPQIYARDGRQIVIFGPFRVNPGTMLDPHGAPQIQKEFEGYLQKVRKELERHIAALRPNDLTIVFSGGGGLQVPDWFMAWCSKMGIRMVFAPDPQGRRGEEENVLDYILTLRQLLDYLEEPGPDLERFAI